MSRNIAMWNPKNGVILAIGDVKYLCKRINGEEKKFPFEGYVPRVGKRTFVSKRSIYYVDNEKFTYNIKEPIYMILKKIPSEISDKFPDAIIVDFDKLSKDLNDGKEYHIKHWGFSYFI